MGIPQPQMRGDGFGDRGGRFDMRRMRLWPVTYWLIVVNVVVFLAQLTSGDAITAWGEFSVARAIRGWELWRFLTFQFLHGSLWHLLFNMIALYWFGTAVETRLGGKRYLAFYLISGVCGAGAYLVLWKLGFLDRDEHVGLIGASAGIFGILVAVINLAPGMMVRLLFPPILIRVRTLALLFIALAVLTILMKGDNAGGEASHIGGALGGWLMIANVNWLNLFDRSKRRRRFWRPGDPAGNFFREDAR